MSYCRWSSHIPGEPDHVTSNVYVYHSLSGLWTIIVANRQRKTPNPEDPEPKLSEDTVEEWSDWSDRNWENINLPHDGKTFQMNTPGEAADKLIELREIGYRVPQYAIDELIKESDE